MEEQEKRPTLSDISDHDPLSGTSSEIDAGECVNEILDWVRSFSKATDGEKKERWESLIAKLRENAGLAMRAHWSAHCARDFAQANVGSFIRDHIASETLTHIVNECFVDGRGNPLLESSDLWHLFTETQDVLLKAAEELTGKRPTEESLKRGRRVSPRVRERQFRIAVLAMKFAPRVSGHLDEILKQIVDADTKIPFPDSWEKTRGWKDWGDVIAACKMSGKERSPSRRFVRNFIRDEIRRLGMIVGRPKVSASVDCGTPEDSRREGAD